MILQNVRLYKKQNKIIDLHLKDSNNKKDNKILNLNGAIIAPRLIDFNTSLKNQIISTKNLNSLSHKAFQGGLGAVGLINVEINNELVIEFINNLNDNLKCKILPIIYPLTKEHKIADISILHSLGCMGIYLQSNWEANIIDKIAKYAKMLDIPLFVNADDEIGGVMNCGNLSAKLGLSARSALSETKEVAKILEVAIFYNIKVVFSAISEPRSIELINNARKNNKNIYCEVSIHHLILDESYCSAYNTYAKINPPLKDIKTKEILINYLKENKIHLLTSLQKQWSENYKKLVFNEAKDGIDCIEWYFSLLYHNLVRSGIITLEKLIELCAINPLKILNKSTMINRELNNGTLEAGSDTKFIIINTDEEIEINKDKSPYSGRYYGIITQF